MCEFLRGLWPGFFVRSTGCGRVFVRGGGGASEVYGMSFGASIGV